MNFQQVIATLITDFQEGINFPWTPDIELQDALKKFLIEIGNIDLCSDEERGKKLIELINNKLDINKTAFQKILDEAALLGIFFDYHKKMRILSFLDYYDNQGFHDWLVNEIQISPNKLSHLISLFTPITPDETIRSLKEEISSDDHADDFLKSIFGAYVFNSFNLSDIHRKVNPEAAQIYYRDFWDHLQIFYPNSLNRDCGLIVLRINNNIINELGGFTNSQNILLDLIKFSFEELSNYCFFAIIVEPIDNRWELISDFVLFSEKFMERTTNISYFRENQVRQQTLEYIPDIKESDARFDLVNEGLKFKDCIIFTPIVDNASDEYSCCLLFEKNERDEALIPCPTCRTKNVRGNSYPTIGVKSWECQNQFCPDRSKYNRGKRYSIQSLIKQRALLDERNNIPVDYLRLWRRDVVQVNSQKDIIEMLLRLYSLVNDKIIFFNINEIPDQFNREITYKTIPKNDSKNDMNSDFYNKHYFKRYKIAKRISNNTSISNLSKFEDVEVYCGDAFDVLQQFKKGSIDGAVTSPPYYNAKDYSSWPNIYCYLYDMFNIGKEIYRVLKRGSPFIFNIFDYFDNENNIVFSAMGKKRMILSHYIINLFLDTGFRIVENIPWDKGEIQGFRNFNQSNTSPYYQNPHNCWEHVLVFSKGIPNFDVSKLPKILVATPTFKFRNGENILGHSAPFPANIPNLLFSLLKPGAIILDPFSGSMTTGRNAYNKGFHSINIDYKIEYCELGLKLLSEENKVKQLSLLP